MWGRAEPTHLKTVSSKALANGTNLSGLPIKREQLISQLIELS
jgi:hypothetical protein